MAEESPTEELHPGAWSPKSVRRWHHSRGGLCSFAASVFLHRTRIVSIAVILLYKTWSHQKLLVTNEDLIRSYKRAGLSPGLSVHRWHHGPGGLWEDLLACKSRLGKRPRNASAGSSSSYLLCFETGNLILTQAEARRLGSEPPLKRSRCLFCRMTQRGDNAGRTGRWLMIYTACRTCGNKSICWGRGAGAALWSGDTTSKPR